MRQSMVFSDMSSDWSPNKEKINEQNYENLFQLRPDFKTFTMLMFFFLFKADVTFMSLNSVVFVLVFESCSVAYWSGIVT